MIFVLEIVLIPTNTHRGGYSRKRITTNKNSAMEFSAVPFYGPLTLRCHKNVVIVLNVNLARDSIDSQLYQHCFIYQLDNIGCIKQRPV